MTEQAANIAETSKSGPADRSWLQKLRAWYHSSEGVRGYTLLSPTLLVMLFSMCIPFIMMVMYSFWTQTGYDFNFDTSFTTANYEKIA
ncbi:MAG: hypothetical protein AAF353_17330, partial [Pseudomonadota bacterium]